MRFGNQIDVSAIGLLVDTPAQEEGEQPTFRNGHFVTSVEPIPEWERWRVDEALPRVFAGRSDSTTLYQFPSEQAFLNAFAAGEPEPEPEEPPPEEEPAP